MDSSTTTNPTGLTPWKIDTTPATPLKLDMANLAPMEFPPNPRSLHRLPTPDPSRRKNSSLGSEKSYGYVDVGGTIHSSPKVMHSAGLSSNTHGGSGGGNVCGSPAMLAPPGARLSPLPSPTAGGPDDMRGRLGEPSEASPSASESGWSPQSNTSKTSAFFGSGFGSTPAPAPAPPAPLVKSKSISRLSREVPARSSSISAAGGGMEPSSFAFNAGTGGANVNRSMSDSQRRPGRAQTANASFFSQNSATLTPAPPPSLSRRPSARNRPKTPPPEGEASGSGTAQQPSPDRARLPPRDRFFPSRGNVERRDQWEEATGDAGLGGYRSSSGLSGYGSPPRFGSTSALNGFGSTGNLSALGSSGSIAGFADGGWGGSQASTGWGGSTGGSSRGVSPARPEDSVPRRTFVDIEERADSNESGENASAGAGKNAALPTLTTSFSADWRALAGETNTPRPIPASLPTPISLTPTKKPVRSANAAGSGLARQRSLNQHQYAHSHLHREHHIPRPPEPEANTHLYDGDVKLRLIRPLGLGAFSCVWLAEDEQGSLAGDRRAHSTSEAKRRRDRRMHGLRPAGGERVNGESGEGAGKNKEVGKGRDDVNRSAAEKASDGAKKGGAVDEDAARGRDISRQQSPLLVEASPASTPVPPLVAGAPGRLVAVKMMDRALCDVNDRTRISFVREVEVLRHISHPSIVAYLHSFTSPTHHCLVVEHIRGGELFELINKDANRSKMTEPLLRRLWGELCRAVGWMHSVALVHRDIKLENILVTSNPFENPVPPLTIPLLKLTDFGLSRFIDPAHPELTTRCGSEEYAAPEIIMGAPYDGRDTDAWACGVVLFALGTGVLPFADPPATSPAPSSPSPSVQGQSQRRAYLLRVAQCQYDPRGLSEGARRIVGKLLVRTPANRARVAELWSDSWMRGAGAPPPPPGLELAGAGEDGTGGGAQAHEDEEETSGDAYLVDQEGIDSVARQEIPLTVE